MAKHNLFAAQVVLAGAPEEPARATAQQIASLQPDPRMIAEAKREFEAMGFRTGPVVGFSFSVEGAPKLFRDTFGVDLVYGRDGSVRRKGKPTQALESLPITGLPDPLRRSVKSVLFSPPPAFGPGVLP